LAVGFAKTSSLERICSATTLLGEAYEGVRGRIHVFCSWECPPPQCSIGKSILVEVHYGSLAMPRIIGPQFRGIRRSTHTDSDVCQSGNRKP